MFIHVSRQCCACLFIPLLFVSNIPCRNIDKAGGLDQYILKTSDRKLDSDLAEALKAEMKERLSLRRKRAEPIGVPLAAQPLAMRDGES